ncbi:hypothetical protein JCM10207_006123 [Rhodosporidiobolus poonsookiae]
MSWVDVERRFLSVPWSSAPSSDGDAQPLLLKLLYDPEQYTLSIMAYDQASSQVVYETLNRRQLQRRVEDALENEQESAGSQVMVGIGEDGEQLLQKTVDKLLDAVRTESATASFQDVAFEPIVDLSVGKSLSFRFRPTSLEQRSAAVLVEHLLNPLLGANVALLSVLRQSTADDEALQEQVAQAVDASGSAERDKPGNASRRFMSLGGAGIVTRWLQRTVKEKEKNIHPVTLSLPSRSTRAATFSPSPTKRKRTASPTTATSPPPRKVSQPSSSHPTPSMAQRMLDHHGGKGERVGWEDSQPVPLSPSKKGKGRAIEPEEGGGDAAMGDTADRSVEEDEPATEDEADGRAGSPLRPQSRQPASSPPRRAGSYLSPPSPSAHRRSPSAAPMPSPSQASLVAPSPTMNGENEAEEEEQDAEEKKRKAKEAKKAAKAKEEEDEQARRKARLAQMAGGRVVTKKKAVKKL